MKKVIFCLVVLCGSMSLSAQNEVKLSGSAKISSETIAMLGGSVYSENPSFSTSLGLKKGEWNLSLSRISDLLDKTTAGNYTFLTGVYSKKLGNWTVSPMMYLLVFDKVKMDMVIPTLAVSYSGKVSVEVMGACASLFEADDLAVIRLKGFKSYQDWTLNLYAWEKSAIGSGKWNTSVAVQVSKKVFQFQNGVSLTAETTYHFTDLFGQSNRFGWVGVSLNF
jgi:hypothetical protein